MKNFIPTLFNEFISVIEGGLVTLGVVVIVLLSFQLGNRYSENFLDASVVISRSVETNEKPQMIGTELSAVAEPRASLFSVAL